jgi:hypothetical protein
MAQCKEHIMSAKHQKQVMARNLLRTSSLRPFNCSACGDPVDEFHKCVNKLPTPILQAQQALSDLKRFMGHAVNKEQNLVKGALIARMGAFNAIKAAKEGKYRQTLISNINLSGKRARNQVEFERSTGVSPAEVKRVVEDGNQGKISLISRNINGCFNKGSE